MPLPSRRVVLLQGGQLDNPRHEDLGGSAQIQPMEGDECSYMGMLGMTLSKKVVM